MLLRELFYCYNRVMVTIGVDEVGRGCWAGPLVAAAVILPAPLPGLKDSKLLSKAQREILNQKVMSSAAAYGIGWVEAEEVDSLGLTAAVRLAMERALMEVVLPYDELIIDGSYNFFAANPKARAIIRADQTVPAVSAASIIAKVARDRRMRELAHDYPDYGFDKHVGYGTRLHRERLELYGVSQLHRRSYKPIQALLQ
jgi:ribonuclease HII